jgi:hypothetical protein
LSGASSAVPGIKLVREEKTFRGLPFFCVLFLGKQEKYDKGEVVNPSIFIRWNNSIISGATSVN